MDSSSEFSGGPRLPSSGDVTGAMPTHQVAWPGWQSLGPHYLYYIVPSSFPRHIYLPGLQTGPLSHALEETLGTYISSPRPQFEEAAL